MFKPGQKIRCVDDSGVKKHLTAGRIYVFDRYKTDNVGTWVYLVAGNSDQPGGWYQNRFVAADDLSDFERFMDRVKKPVDLREPVSA